MLAKDFVSIVIPCFNASDFLKSTIDSVLNQTHKNFELIVVDDKSTDTSTDIVRSYAAMDPRVKLLELPSNAGAPAAPRNRGVELAQGEWIAFLDADDIWHPQKLELQLAVLKSHGASMCSTQMKDFYYECEISKQSAPENPRIQSINHQQQLIKYRTPTSSIVIRRDLMLINKFNEDLRYKAREDTDCFIRVHEFFEFSLKICFPLVFYRQQINQISGNKIKMVRRHLFVLKEYKYRSGKSLGLKAYFYTATHFISSIYIRWIRRSL